MLAMIKIALVVLLSVFSGATAEAHRLSRDGKITMEIAASEEQAARETFAATVPFLDGLVKDASRLHEALRKAGIALVQVSSTAKPEATLTAKPAAVQAKIPLLKAGAITSSPVAKPLASPVATQAKQAKKAFDVQAAADEMGKMTKIQPMLGLVSGMYDAWKDKISDANKKEQDSKKDFQETIKDLEEKKRKFRGEANATACYDRIERYWKKQREISHRQYHTALKLMHGGMQKFKSVMTAMKDAVAGKKPTGAELTNLQRLVPPEVVFLQVKVKELSIWTKGAIAILRDARNPRGGMGKAGAL